MMKKLIFFPWLMSHGKIRIIFFENKLEKIIMYQIYIYISPLYLKPSMKFPFNLDVLMDIHVVLLIT